MVRGVDGLAWPRPLAEDHRITGARGADGVRPTGCCEMEFGGSDSGFF